MPVEMFRFWHNHMPVEICCRDFNLLAVSFNSKLLLESKKATSFFFNEYVHTYYNAGTKQNHLKGKVIYMRDLVLDHKVGKHMSGRDHVRNSLSICSVQFLLESAK